MDSEYLSDLQTFSNPAEWDAEWRASTGPVKYRITGASLDCCSLLLRQELWARKTLAPGFDFRFRLQHNEDKDLQEQHLWVEMEKSVGRGFSLIAFGEPTFKKEDADIGAGAAWRGGPWRLAARRNLVDFNFNSRGSTAERYDRKPLTDDFEASWSRGGHSVLLYAELDHPLSRRVPAQDRVFAYRRTTASALYRREPPADWAWEGGYRYERLVRGDHFEPPASGSSLFLRRQVHEARAALWGAVAERTTLEVGHLLVVRNSRGDDPQNPHAGFFENRWESQPYARWRRRLKPGLVGELASFLAFGEDRRRYAAGASPSTFDRIAEAKLGAGLDFLFGPAGRIGLYGAFDLDDLHRHLWDGGSVRAMIFF